MPRWWRGASAAVVAAPVYLERHGAPATPADLAAHTCLIHDATAEVWRFIGPDGPLSVRVTGAFIANDSEAIRRVAGAGHGIALLPEIQLIDDLRARRLFRLMEGYHSQRVPVHIVYPSRRNLAPRTRVVMDFLVEQTREILRAAGGADLRIAAMRRATPMCRPR